MSAEYDDYFEGDDWAREHSRRQDPESSDDGAKMASGSRQIMRDCITQIMLMIYPAGLTSSEIADICWERFSGLAKTKDVWRRRADDHPDLEWHKLAPEYQTGRKTLYEKRNGGNLNFLTAVAIQRRTH
jgi:hypothetical protein